MAVRTNVGLLLTLTAVGCSTATEMTLEKAVVGGAVETGDPMVVALVAGGEQFCTGTLIAPDIVVTAAHCLPPHTSHELEEIGVFFGLDLSQGGELIPSAEALAHPEWSEDRFGNDIGLLLLAQPSPYPGMEMIADVVLAAPVGENTRLVGYGVSAKGADDNGVKRSGFAAVESLDSLGIYLEAGPSLTCGGDSGGPLLIRNDEVDRIAGVHSRSDCQSLSLAERVDVHLQDFIAAFLREHGYLASCMVDGRCRSDCDEPDLDCVKERAELMCSDDRSCEAELRGSGIGCSSSGESGGPMPTLVLAFLLVVLGRQTGRSFENEQRH